MKFKVNKLPKTGKEIEWLESSPAPDLVVVQIEVAELAAETFADIKKVRAAVPDAKWLVLSQRTDLTFLRAAVQSGVDGLLLEDSPGEVLQHLAELVLLGYSFVPSELARILSDGAVASTLLAAPSKSPAFGGHGNVSWGELKAPPLARAEPTDVPNEAIETAASVTNGLLRRQQVNLSDRENEILRCLVRVTQTR